jgi:plasmid stability protein
LVGQLSIRDFPDDLQRQARIEAIEAGESLKDLVIEAVRREVERRRAERPDRPR